MGILVPQGQSKAPPLLTTNRAGGINTARQVIYQVFSKHIIIAARGPTRSPGELTTVQVLYRSLERRRDRMTPEDKLIIFRVAQWVSSGNRKVVETIRQLAETEANYRIIIREIERVASERSRAHTLGAEATLTLVDWFTTLVDFDWRCAYCQSRPFQIMSHVTPLPGGGTVVENCVPACYRCCRYKKTEHVRMRVQAYLSNRKHRDENARSQDVPSIPLPLS